MCAVCLGYHRTTQWNPVVHLDLVQEATRKKWSDVEKEAPSTLARLRGLDMDFLRWQLATFPFRLVLCDGATASEAVRRLFASGRPMTDSLPMLPGRRTWLDVVTIDGRNVWAVGWNVPLNAVSVSADDLRIAGQVLQVAVGS
jgi:hypothetical protein